MRLKLAPLLVALTGVLLAFAAVDESEAPRPNRASWLAPVGDPARGAKLAWSCTTCHAPGATVSNPPAPKLHRQRASYLFFALLDYRNGARTSTVMRPFAANLSEQDMRDLAVHFAGQAPVKPPEPMTRNPYHARAARECTWCHGETGIGELEGMPILTGQKPKYLASALEEYRAGVRSNPAMREVAARLSATDRAGFAGYYGGYVWLEEGR